MSSARAGKQHRRVNVWNSHKREKQQDQRHIDYYIAYYYTIIIIYYYNYTIIRL